MERIAGVVGVPQQVVKRPQEFVLILNESIAQRRTDLRRGLAGEVSPSRERSGSLVSMRLAFPLLPSI